MVIASPVEGLRPGRDLVAGLCTIAILTSPLIVNCLCCRKLWAIVSSSASSTLTTSDLDSPDFSAIAACAWALVGALFFLLAVFLAGIAGVEFVTSDKQPVLRELYTNSAKVPAPESKPEK